MGNLKNYSTIGLNGVSEQVKQYEKEGFQPSHSNTRWYGDLFSWNNLSIKINTNTSVSIQQPTSIRSLINYDARFFFASRPAFLSQWLTMPCSHVLAAIENSEICGYGVISKTTNGYKIAPLVANNQVIAERLYVALCRCVGKQDSVYIDTPNNNPEAVNLMHKIGLKKTFDTFRMYKGQVRTIDNSQWFGLTSLEIG